MKSDSSLYGPHVARRRIDQTNLAPKITKAQQSRDRENFKSTPALKAAVGALAQQRRWSRSEVLRYATELTLHGMTPDQRRRLADLAQNQGVSETDMLSSALELALPLLETQARRPTRS